VAQVIELCFASTKPGVQTPVPPKKKLVYSILKGFLKLIKYRKCL
jgi:hypothetical protein